MALDPTTTTHYGVARGTDLVGDLTTDLNAAQRKHAEILETARTIGIEDNLDVVQVEVKTTYGKPTKYRTPKIEEPE